MSTQNDNKNGNANPITNVGVFKQVIPKEDPNDPFDRQKCIGGWNQTLIEKQTALVLGVGGIGCTVAMALARLGIGRIILIDYDKVEYSNLNRQILFTLSNVGRFKVDAAQENLKKYHIISSKTQIEAYNVDAIKRWTLIVELAKKSTVIFNQLSYGVGFDIAVISLSMKLQIPYSSGSSYCHTWIVEYFTGNYKKHSSFSYDNRDINQDVFNKLIPNKIMDYNDLSFIPQDNNPSTRLIGSSSLCSITGGMMTVNTWIQGIIQAHIMPNYTKMDISHYSDKHALIALPMPVIQIKDKDNDNDDVKDNLIPIEYDFSVIYDDIHKSALIVEKTKQLYTKYCQSLIAMEAQIPLWRLFTVGQLNNNKPVLQLIYSSYLRDRIHYLINNQKPLKYNEWVDKSLTIKRILKYHKNTAYINDIKKDISSALKLFFRRRCVPIQVDGMEKINDDINKYALIILDAIRFIKQAVNTTIIPPFQLDIWIIPKSIKNMADSDTDDDDYDDMDDDTDDDNILEGCNSINNSEIAELGDISLRLKQSGCIYQSDKKSKRDLNRLFKQQFLGPMRAKYNYNDQLQNDLIYPHRHRICAIVDHRMQSISSKGVNYKEPTYMFEPITNNIYPSINEYVPEWCIEASLSHILPPFYDDDDNDNDNDNDDNKNNKKLTPILPAINAKSNCKGQMFCVSFQIEEANIQRCWLFNRGQMFRFMPNDIINVLPKLFMNGKNILTKIIKDKIPFVTIPDQEFDKIYTPIPLPVD